jgi:hypothetical protein
VAPGTKYSVLDHLRHLLAVDPELDALGLRGGLTSWFVRDIDKVLVWAGSARDDWKGKDTQQMRQQLIRILDVLDSAAYVQKVGDVPSGTPLLINTPVALLEFDPQSQDPPGYLEHISQHLKALITAPGASKTQINLAKEVIGSLNNVLGWLQRIHQDAKQLEQISDNRQLLTPTSLSTLNDMATEALYAYLGQLDPTTNQVMEGAVQIRNDMVRLATFDIRSYKM